MTTRTPKRASGASKAAEISESKRFEDVARRLFKVPKTEITPQGKKV